MEGEVLLAKGRVLVEERRGEKPAVEAVRPRVVGAPDRRGDGVLRAEPRAAVAADVVVGPEGALARPGDEKALAEEIEHAERAGVGQVAGTAPRRTTRG